MCFVGLGYIKTKLAPNFSNAFHDLADRLGRIFYEEKKAPSLCFELGGE